MTECGFCRALEFWDNALSQHLAQFHVPKTSSPSQRAASTRPTTQSARAHLVGRFTSRTTVAEQLPGGTLGMNLGCAKTLILAVVPFEQVAIDVGCDVETV